MMVFYNKSRNHRLKDNRIIKCDNFYSDSISDEPISKIAKRSYIVNGDKIINWNDYGSCNWSYILLQYYW